MMMDDVQIYNNQWQYLGGYVSSGDEILEWDATNEEWKVMGKMKESRGYRAMAVVEVDEVLEYCT